MTITSKPNFILSICIPTYNRAVCLEFLLNNIIEQLESNTLWDKVEICISDNCSTDNTIGVVRDIQKLYAKLKIRYRCNETNLGFDRNLLSSVALATGAYCWLFGDDDKFEPNAILTIIQYLAAYKDDELNGIVLCYQPYSYDFKTKLPLPYPYKIKNNFVGNSASEIYTKLGRYVGCISNQIIKREKWVEVVNKYDLTKYYNQYIHVYILSQMMKDYPKWAYLSKILVGWRADNDSALGNKDNISYIKRFKLEYVFLDVAKDLFGKYSWVYLWHTNHFCNFIIFGGLQRLKFERKINIYPLFWEITIRSWICPAFYFKVLPVFILPNFLIRLIHRIKGALRTARFIR